MRKTLLFTAAGFSAAASSAFAQYVTAPTGPGGTWNLYELNAAGLTWNDANNAANARTYGTLPGHLLSVHSGTENHLIQNFAGNGDVWLGLSDNPALVAGGAETGSVASGSNLVPPTNGAWAWSSGEAFTYANWGGGEPNNAGVGESVGHIRGDEMWNDNGAGTLGESSPAMRSVIEYETQSASPVFGAAILSDAVDNNPNSIWAKPPTAGFGTTPRSATSASVT
ncbi:MAG: hypothetical protein R3F11_18060 [Verrucomicrobiales bacterium]